MRYLLNLVRAEGGFTIADEIPDDIVVLHGNARRSAMNNKIPVGKPSYMLHLNESESANVTNLPVISLSLALNSVRKFEWLVFCVCPCGVS